MSKYTRGRLSLLNKVRSICQHLTGLRSLQTPLTPEVKERTVKKELMALRVCSICRATDL